MSRIDVDAGAASTQKGNITGKNNISLSATSITGASTTGVDDGSAVLGRLGALAAGHQSTVTRDATKIMEIYNAFSDNDSDLAGQMS